MSEDVSKYLLDKKKYYRKSTVIEARQFNGDIKKFPFVSVATQKQIDMVIEPYKSEFDKSKTFAINRAEDGFFNWQWIKVGDWVVETQNGYVVFAKKEFEANYAALPICEMEADFISPEERKHIEEDNEWWDNYRGF